MKYHALFVVVFFKATKFNCRLLQIIGGALKGKFALFSNAFIIKLIV